VSELPGGTVTLLFTDIEGSTRLLKRLRGRYEQVLEDHQRLLRAAFEGFRGQEIDSQGDSFYVAFGRAIDAIEAAVSAQRALAAHRWPAGQAVRVRMGVHTGEPKVSRGRYVGLGVHRGARICAAAHGGQILISKAVQELVHEDLPRGVALRDLGAHSLKDLDRPEHIFQVVIERLRDRFPPIRDVPPGADKGAERVRVVLADDAAVLREGLARLLEEEGFQIVGQVGDAAELRRVVDAELPDVVVVDIRMPPSYTDEGLQAAQEIRAAHPGIGLVVLSQHVDLDYAMKLLTEQAGRVGYLLKDRVIDLAEFAAALRHISAGGAVVDPSLVARLMSKPRTDARLAELTPREREVLALMAEGRTDTAIAEHLGVAPRTVAANVRVILRKLDIPRDVGQSRRVHAVLAFLRASHPERSPL
jgi:DNA-binding NarL/FixJ family response regulator/class 3 adenylate cyclase